MSRPDKEVIRRLDEILRRVERIERELRPRIATFIIKEISMLPIAPGFSPVFTATPVPAGAVPAAGNLPAWTTDLTDAALSIDETGLVCTLSIPSSAVAGTAFTLNISYTNADGTVATGTISLTVAAPPVTDITSFTIEQTS